MNCEQARLLIGPYADGELDASAVVELERHIRECAACAHAWQNARTLQSSLRQDGLYFEAPTDLRRSIYAQLKESTCGQTERRPGWRFNWNWFGGMATGAAAVALAVLLALPALRPSEQARLGRDVVASHIRSLMANHELDVVSTDQHTVKPWFNGKLDFSPPVKDLSADEFPLVGGRLDYVGGRDVAALVFQRHKHVINLFVWPVNGEDSAPAEAASIQGFNGVRWIAGGMSFWAVSDLNGKELLEFAHDYVAGPVLK
jgi:anti-sigma factor RsiW